MDKVHLQKKCAVCDSICDIFAASAKAKNPGRVFYKCSGGCKGFGGWVDENTSAKVEIGSNSTVSPSVPLSGDVVEILKRTILTRENDLQMERARVVSLQNETVVLQEKYNKLLTKTRKRMAKERKQEKNAFIKTEDGKVIANPAEIEKMTEDLKSRDEEIGKLKVQSAESEKMLKNWTKKYEELDKSFRVLSSDMRTMMEIESSRTNTRTETHLCMVCFDHPKQAMFLPCNHFATCMGCADTIEKTTKKCPSCRTPFYHIEKVFLVG